MRTYRVFMGHCGWFIGLIDNDCTLQEWEFVAENNKFRAPDGELWEWRKDKNSFVRPFTQQEREEIGEWVSPADDSPMQSQTKTLMVLSGLLARVRSFGCRALAKRPFF